jgi:hypothetical protein
LGITLADIEKMTAPEFAVWRDWYVLHGFPSERVEFTTANGAAYVGGCWGGKATAKQIAPHVPAEEKDDIAGVMAWFDSVCPAKE